MDDYFYNPIALKKNFLIDCISLMGIVQLIDCIPLMGIVQLIDSDSIILVNQLCY